MFKWTTRFYYFITFLALSFSSPLLSGEKGSAIITYQTGPQEERLDRVRFWLRCEGVTPQMHPKGEAFVQERSCSSRMVVIDDLSPGTYTLEFIVPNADGYFEEPPKRTFEIAAGKIVKVDQYIKPRFTIPQTVEVLEGVVIVGDPFDDRPENIRPPKQLSIPAFSIGIFEVTNSQYAEWLNRALEDKKITLNRNPDKRGQITDTDGKLLFKTLEADPFSQIYTETNGESYRFLPVIGKHNFPVIDVTWYGAEAYSKELGLRLPNEAEWEKAAGMALAKEGDPPAKFKYGFSYNEIDLSWANYKELEQGSKANKVDTSRVGFYNGKNTLDNGTVTHDGRSPVGCYDMSGNVWEWVNELYSPSGEEMVAKGGCYDSLADGVRVAERLGLPRDHADPYTGFRVAR